MLSPDQVLNAPHEEGQDSKEGNGGFHSAYIPNNPDFDPSKDVPQARSCDTMMGIIAND
jgi:hypothetical protein